MSVAMPSRRIPNEPSPAGLETGEVDAVRLRSWSKCAKEIEQLERAAGPGLGCWSRGNERHLRIGEADRLDRPRDSRLCGWARGRAKVGHIA